MEFHNVVNHFMILSRHVTPWSQFHFQETSIDNHMESYVIIWHRMCEVVQNYVIRIKTYSD